MKRKPSAAAVSGYIRGEITRPTREELSEWANKALGDVTGAVSWSSATVRRMLKEIGLLKLEARKLAEKKPERRIILPSEVN